MKKVPCAYKDCGERRAHWQTPDIKRGTVMIEVADDRPDDKPMYCSITCACLSGAMSIRRQKGYCTKCGFKLTLVGDNDHEPEKSGAFCPNCETYE